MSVGRWDKFICSKDSHSKDSFEVQVESRKRI